MGEDGNEFFVLITDFLTKISKGGIQSNEFQTGGIFDPRRRSGEGNAIEALTCITLPLSREFSREFSLVYARPMVHGFAMLRLDTTRTLTQMMPLLPGCAGKGIHPLHKPLF